MPVNSNCEQTTNGFSVVDKLSDFFFSVADLTQFGFYYKGFFWDSRG